MVKAKWIEFECQLPDCTNIRRQREKDYNRNKHHYCSVQCLGKARASKAISERKIITFTCEAPGCTNQRTTSRCAYNSKKNHFCSIKCSSKNNNKKADPDKTITIICSNPHCNNTRDMYKSSDRGGSHFCSKECSRTTYKPRHSSINKAINRIDFINRWNNMMKDMYD